MKPRVFLSAQWRYLANLTWAVDPELLRPWLHPDLELDLIEGKAHISLVAFMFLDTKVKGIRIPFHVNFPEINLRFYVRKGNTRGVMFIREFVPKRCIALVANKIYNEPYETAKMTGERIGLESAIRGTNGHENQNANMHYKMRYHNSDLSLQISGGEERIIPPKGSAGHHFKEHDTGFGISKKGKLLEYKVEHPEWECFNVLEYNLAWEPEKIYGKPWGILAQSKPNYVFFIDGSDVKVFGANSP